jgi:ribosome-associated protein
MTELLKKVYEALTDLKLYDIDIYDFVNHSPYFDYQIIATASNERQVHAAINHIKQIVPADSHFHVEGSETNRWLLIDLKDIIIHVMHKEERDFYQIEKLFFERKKVIFEDK